MVVLGVLLVVGVLCGRAVAHVVTPAEFTKLAQGGSMGEDELGRQFGADGWYVVIGAGAGLLLGLLLTGGAPATRCWSACCWCWGGAGRGGDGDRGAPARARQTRTRWRRPRSVGGSRSASTWGLVPTPVWGGRRCPSTSSWPVGAILGAVVVLLGDRSDDSSSSAEDPHYA